MLKLAFLLIGPASFRGHWHGIAALGVGLMVLAVAVATDVLPAVSAITYDALGLAFALYGVLALAAAAAARRGALAFIGPACSILAAILVLLAPLENDLALGLFYAVLFLVDGIGRIVPAVVGRFVGWRVHVGVAVGEFVLAMMLISGWPVSRSHDVHFCVGLFIAGAGWLLLRLGLMLRTLDPEVAILMLPIFAGRGWYEHAPILVQDDDGARRQETPILLRVWTPRGCANITDRMPILDRYIGAVDRDGSISTGHSSMEVAPDVYISHYPRQELTRSSDHFLHALRGAKENDAPGLFQPGYAAEVAQWVEADREVRFHTYNPRRLRAFWIGYRQDSTYNVVNRNCSTVIAGALDAALEGALATDRPWRRLLALTVNPDMWLAGLMRLRADSATWTPGFLLDYALPLARVVDRPDLSWHHRFTWFLARFRRPEEAGAD